MSTVTELVKSIISSEESRVAQSWRYPDRRLAILEICRAIDSLALGAQTDGEAAEFSRQGANKAILLFMDHSCTEQRAPLFPSDSTTFRWAHSVLQHCGRIAICETFLEYEKAGLGKFSKKGEDLEFEVMPKYSGIEAIEREQFGWLANSTSETQRPLRGLLDSLEPKVHDRMRQLVYVWYEHYIGYGGSPQIDAYFDHRGILAAQRMIGHDVFADNAKFGGLPFGFYRASVWTLVGWALKHITFALLLHEMHPELHLQNLLTVTADVTTLTSEIAASLQVTPKEASQALSLLELNLDNARQICTSGHTIPPLIRAASEQFLKPVAAFLDEPFQFMLRNLRMRYQTDWDKAVNNRELLFREELFRLFPQAWLIKMPRSLKLTRRRQLLTDIDAVVLDERSGVVGLFQLKWQDPFGRSMRERSARMKNFQREANSWIEVVTEFLAHSTDQERKRILGCPKLERPLECRLFVVGRYFAHFSGEVKPDARAVWAVWPQLVRLAKAAEDSDCPVLALHCAVANDSPFNKTISSSFPSFNLAGRLIRMTNTKDAD